MRRRIAHGLAVFLCVASLGAAQGNSGSALDQSSLVRPQPKPAHQVEAFEKANRIRLGLRPGTEAISMARKPPAVSRSTCTTSRRPIHPAPRDVS